MGLWENGTRTSCPKVAQTENLSRPTLQAHFQAGCARQLQNLLEEPGLQNHPQISPRTALACLLLRAGLASAVSVEAPCGPHCTQMQIQAVTQILSRSLGTGSPGSYLTTNAK